MLRRIVSIAGLCLTLSACSIPEPPRTNEPPAFYVSLASPTARLDAGSARDLFNGYRRNLGLAPLEIDPALMAFAEKEAQVLAASDRVDATRDRTLNLRLARAGIQSAIAAENVSAGYHTVSDAFSGWRGSPRHDATLRAAGARRFGLATAYRPGSKYKIFWVLVVTD